MKMLFLFPLLLINIYGTIEARRPEIDRLQFLTSEAKYKNSRPHRRRSLPEAFNLRTNDYDDHSGRFVEQRTPLYFDPKPYSFSTKPPLKVYQPREDPRLFYQTDAYHKEIMSKKINNNEVTFVYPGIEVIRTNENYNLRKPFNMKMREQDQEVNIITEDSICIRCPNDRTLVARAGFDKVLLHPPHVYTCSGLKAPRDISFIPIYGPKFGSFLLKGTYMVLGRISYNGQSYHLCEMYVHVITQTCTTPLYLVSHCGIRDKPCNFTCRDPQKEIFGKSSLLCGSDMKWKGDLPVCKVRTTWCKTPSPPAHGRVSCIGEMVHGRSGFVEGSKCRVRCQRGFRWRRATAVCRQGSWSDTLKCTLKRSM